MATNPADKSGSTMIAELRLVKWMDDSGVIHCEDLSGDNSGGEISDEERNDLLMYALGKQIMPYVILWLESTYGKKLGE